MKFGCFSGPEHFEVTSIDYSVRNDSQLVVHLFLKQLQVNLPLIYVPPLSRKCYYCVLIAV